MLCALILFQCYSDIILGGKWAFCKKKFCNIISSFWTEAIETVRLENFCWIWPACLKVRLSQNGFMKSSIFQKMTRKIWRISALRVFIVHSRAEIFRVIFWKIDDFINPFWLNLNFTIAHMKRHLNSYRPFHVGIYNVFRFQSF